MKAIASKKIAEILAEEIKKRSSYCIEGVTYSRRVPGWNDDIDGYDRDGRPYAGIINVYYIPEMYACHKEFYTRDIQEMARRAEGSLEGFVSEFIEAANI